MSSRNMIDYIFCYFMWWVKLVQSFTLSFILEVFQDSTFAKLPDKNLDYLVAEGIDKNVNHRYMCLKVLAVTKATLIKNLNWKTFSSLSLICQHLNEGAMVRGTSKGHRMTEQSGKRLWKRKCQNNVSTEKKWQENWYVFLNYLQV